MSLITKLNTDNGIVLDAAILVVSRISDNSRTDFHYNLSLNSRSDPSRNEDPIQFNNSQSDNTTRNAHYQVAIFASEELLRNGQPHISLLLEKDTGSENFSIEIDNSETQMDQVYSHLQALYPDSIHIDLTDIGII